MSYNLIFFLSPPLWSQTLGCRPIASLDHFLPEHLGTAGLVEEVPTGTSKIVKVSTLLRAPPPFSTGQK